MSNINWYPGHMTKTRRMMEAELSKVDAVVEILDARIPLSSKNPDIDEILGQKPKLVLLNRCDMADPEVTKLWRRVYPDAIETTARVTAGVTSVLPSLQKLLAAKLARYQERGQTGRGIKIMIVGIPNVGKSTLINTMAGKKIVKVEDRPGVTRGKQWISVTSTLDLLDTPGILWPKLGDQNVAENLAFTGAIKDEVLDTLTLGALLFEKLLQLYPQYLTARYKISLDGLDDIDKEINLALGTELLERAAKKRGFLISRGESDIDRMANTLLDEFRDATLGRISLEKPEH